MAVIAADLTQPAGKLFPGQFPGDDADAFTARVAAYLAQGQARVTGKPANIADPIIIAYVYATAWDAIYTAFLTSPTRFETEGSGAHTFVWQQIDAAREERDRWQMQYDGLIAAASATPPVEPATPPSSMYVGVSLF